MEQSDEMPSRLDDLFSDKGYFVGQRELPHFRCVPRLRLSRPKPTNWKNRSDAAVVAISKCLYATRSLLVVSDGDGQGGLCFQLVDPSKCIVQGEVHVSSAHSSRISAIHMDPIGTGELHVYVHHLSAFETIFVAKQNIMSSRWDGWSWWRSGNCGQR
jgi:hypothetical protein